MAIMHDGLHTLVAFEFAPAIGGVLFKEQQIKPWGFDGRGGINTTSLRNVDFVTKVPKTLIDLTDMTGTFQWDPDLYASIFTFILNVNQVITLFMPNGETYQFYGWLDKFDPQEHQEGELPLANITIIPSNINNVTGLEQGPVRL